MSYYPTAAEDTRFLEGVHTGRRIEKNEAAAREAAAAAERERLLAPLQALDAGPSESAKTLDDIESRLMGGE